MAGRNVQGLLGTNIAENATFERSATNSYHQQLGVSQFCDTRETLKQTDPFCERRCPPDKGWVIVHWNTAEVGHPIVGEKKKHRCSDQQSSYNVKFDAKTKEAERLYCLQEQFELKCPVINWDL
jgi:hypothetical protein